MPVTKPCETCGAKVTRPKSQMKIRVFCSKACAYEGLKLANPKARRRVYLPNHSLADKSGYVQQSRVILYQRIGPGWHSCHWCGKKVRWTTLYGKTKHCLVADHVNDDELDDSPDNLVPSCQSCNGTRWHQVSDDELFITRANGTRLRAVRRKCEKCKGQFLASPSQIAAGRGRFCSRSCLRICILCNSCICMSERRL